MWYNVGYVAAGTSHAGRAAWKDACSAQAGHVVRSHLRTARRRYPRYRSRAHCVVSGDVLAKLLGGCRGSASTESLPKGGTFWQFLSWYWVSYHGVMRA
jgi:hypothetical protein